NDFIRRDRTVTTYRMAQHREGTRCPHIGIDAYRQSGLMFDTHREVGARALAAHVLGNGNEVTGADIAAAESGRAAKEPRDVVQFGISWCSGDRVRKRG